MRGQLPVRGVQFCLVPIRMRDACAQVVTDRERADAGVELVHAHVTVQPHRQLLRERGERKGVGARSQGGDKQLRGDPLTTERISECQSVAEVDENLLPAAMHPAQHHRELLLKTAVQRCELRVLVALRLCALVLLIWTRPALWATWRYAEFTASRGRFLYHNAEDCYDDRHDGATGSNPHFGDLMYSSALDSRVADEAKMRVPPSWPRGELASTSGRI
jgi:hypothetical protein